MAPHGFVLNAEMVQVKDLIDAVDLHSHQVFNFVDIVLVPLKFESLIGPHLP